MVDFSHFTLRTYFPRGHVFVSLVFLRCWVVCFQEIGPTGFYVSRTPKEPEYLIARSDFERGPLGFGPIQFLMDCYVFCLLFFPLTSMIWGLPVDSS